MGPRDEFPALVVPSLSETEWDGNDSSGYNSYSTPIENSEEAMSASDLTSYMLLKTVTVYKTLSLSSMTFSNDPGTTGEPFFVCRFT